MIKKYIKKIFSDVLEEKIPRIAMIATRNAHWELFASIGIDRMKELIEKIEKKQKEVGHVSYTSLAEMYSEICRESIEKNNSDLFSMYFKIQPELKEINEKLQKLSGNQ